jgi:DNA-binding response OmpR family regulator
MIHDEARREKLSEVVKARGLEVATSSGGELLSILGHEAPDAAVLDLALPDIHGVATLLELRDDRAHTGLPVLVLTHGGLNEKEREIVRELATVHAVPARSAEALEYLLDASFPPAGIQGSRP